MQSMDLDATAVRDAGPERIFVILMNWMSDRQLWLDMPRFQPDGPDDGRNLVAIYLAATLVDQFRANPNAMIDYWTRICTIRELFDSHVVDHLGVGALMQHLKVGTNEKTMQFASRLASWEAGGAGATGRQLSRAIRLSGVSVPATRLREPASVQYELYGIDGSDSQREVFTKTFDETDETECTNLLIAAMAAPLQGFHKRLMSNGWPYNHSGSKRPGITGSLANSLGSLRAQLDPDSGTVFGLGAMHVVSAQHSENGIYSFLRIVSAIGELTDLIKDGRASDDAVEALLVRLSQIRSYPAPSPIQGDLQDVDPLGGENELLDTRLNAQVEGQESIAHLLATWLNSFEQDEIRRMALAPVTLARIWTRFTYAFTTIRDGLQHLRTRYLGVLMHRSAIAFLHSVGVESLRASGEPLGAKMVDNPVKSSEPFLSLLKRIDEVDATGNPSVRDAMLWFQFLFSCPLWDYFLAKTDTSIYGVDARSSATQEVYTLYRKRLENRCGITRTLQVQLTHLDDPDMTVEFDSLYSVLNTVQIQGLRSANSNAKSSPVAEVLSRLGAVVEPAPASVKMRRSPALRRARPLPAKS
ncbi:hypothetical protein ASF41_12500 [Methylobacterium sp. Leaf111]|nr:hypothetical protein ASF41_12500 [Methylobacterium sp. Leaf111]